MEGGHLLKDGLANLPFVSRSWRDIAYGLVEVLEVPADASMRELESTLSHFPNTTSVSIRGSSHNALGHLARHCTKLTNIHMYSAGRIFNPAAPGVSLPKVTSLHVKYSDQSVCALSDHASEVLPNLEELILLHAVDEWDNCKQLDAGDLWAHITQFDKLQKLHINCLRWDESTDIPSLGRNFPLLGALSIGGAGISFVRAWFQKGMHDRKLLHTLVIVLHVDEDWDVLGLIENDCTCLGLRNLSLSYLTCSPTDFRLLSSPLAFPLLRVLYLFRVFEDLACMRGLVRSAEQLEVFIVVHEFSVGEDDGVWEVIADGYRQRRENNKRHLYAFVGIGSKEGPFSEPEAAQRREFSCDGITMMSSQEAVDMIANSFDRLPVPPGCH
eukprot:TRINITY_DN11632_c0_g1_i1.p1 TRINITY_DN11632_c0_g1~~TRINITY_DN11632_c0_g1_i1.p1  ORF type:complete len:401 (+),score=31.76 TRINITY_DN11632_c0_g1_i1:52-1203(+)